MNPDKLVPSRTNELDGSFYSIPGRLHSPYSSLRIPQCVNRNGASSMFSGPVDTQYFEDGAEAYSNIGSEVRSLRKTLNLPVDCLPHSRGPWFNQQGGRSSVGQAYFTDSGYSSRTNQQSFEGAQNVSQSRTGQAGYTGPLYNLSPTDVNANLPSLGAEGNSQGDQYGSASYYEKSLKSSLEESETKRILLLEKLREAHLAIQNQAEKLAATESEMCFLRGQLKGMGIEQEGLQQEVECLMMEKRTFEFFRAESIKNREDFLGRINDLDKAFKILTATHNSLQTEAKKKEAVIEQTSLHVNTLHQEKNKLQEVNDGLMKEISTLRGVVDQQKSYKGDVSKQLEQLNNDYQKVVREQAVVKHQLSESIRVIQEARNKQDKMTQEIVQLKMERDVQYGKFSVLEEEILHHQQSYNHLVREQEIVLKEKAEQERRLQREIHEKMSLRMVNDLLKEESANVKEAFKRLEQFTSVMERKSEELNKELDHYKQGSQTSKLKQMTSVQNQNDGLLLKIDHLHSHCKELESKNNSLEDMNRKLKKENDESREQAKLLKMQEEALTKQVKSKELSTANTERMQNENIELRKECETLRSGQVQLEKEQKELLQTNEKLSLQMAKIRGKDHHRESTFTLEEEVDNAKKSISRLESEKVDLQSEVSKLKEEQKAWDVQRSELQMSQAELDAENSQLRSELSQAKKQEEIIAETRKKFESEKEEAVKKAQESMKESFDEVCLELKNVKSELSKVWEMLEIKEKQFEDQTQELQEEREQSQRWAEEVTRLRKSYAELTEKTSNRSQMIATLRDELTQRCEEITNLETKLTTVNQQKCSTVEKSNKKRLRAELKRRRSEGDVGSETSGCGHSGGNSEISGVMAKNLQLNQRIQELLTERDLALHDAQDLLDGMKQLREAFEEEMERELERERSKFEKEKQFIQAQQEKSRGDQKLFGLKSKLHKEVTQLKEEKVALEVKSKHLEFERDELRNQVEELCRMRTAAEEKAVQVDSALSPRKRESKPLSPRKRSKSVGMMPPTVTIEEIPDG